VGGNGRASAESVRNRRHRIAGIVAAHGSITIEELAEATGVSRMTAYRDVAALERAGLITRPEPGVVSDQVVPSRELTTTLRLQREARAKTAIARAAAERVHPGDAILVDDSSTALLAVRELAQVPLTVITNSLLVATQVRDRSDVNLLLVGGHYDARAEAMVGADATAMISSVHADVALLGAVAVDAAGAYHADPLLAEAKRAMVGAARTPMLLVDHSKWHEHALHRFAPLEAFGEVLVDQDTAESERLLVAAAGATLVLTTDITCPHCACKIAGLGSDGKRYLRAAEAGSVPRVHAAVGVCPHCDAAVQGYGFG
jgi:DeoR/GlpR family transcriptional regulator of sugar metabolism